MTQKTYRTAQGKIVDLGALQLKNENVRAVGNMNVNARGDLLDSNNRPIDSRNNQVGRQYKKQVTNTDSGTIHSSRAAAVKSADIPTPPEDFDDTFEKLDDINGPISKTSVPAKSEAQDGLAAAIARARQVKSQ
jgi:hypothetical protein